MSDSAPSHAGHRDHRQTILVIDDDPASVSLIDGALKQAYRIRVALDGERGLQMAGDPLVPDLILLDVVMPKMDGYAVCAALRAHPEPAVRQAPIIFLTSLADEFSTVRAFELGASDFVAKPICPRVLGMRVRTHLALSHQQRDLERTVQERTQRIEALQINIIQCLGRAAEFRDNETGLHVIRMSHYAEALARAAGLDEPATRMLRNAALMHDVGKIGIPDHILLKPGRLNADEMAIIQRHPAIGAEILGGDDSELMQLARTIALTHHEKWDGSGYPQGLKGSAIPLAGRMVAVADVFDALTTVRPYKDAWPVAQAMDYLQGQRGAHFDPALVDHFSTILPEILTIKDRYAE